MPYVPPPIHIRAVVPPWHFLYYDTLIPQRPDRVSNVPAQSKTVAKSHLSLSSLLLPPPPSLHTVSKRSRIGVFARVYKVVICRVVSIADVDVGAVAEMYLIATINISITLAKK
jgi:hypothetical protein